MVILVLIYIVPQVARIFFKQIQQDDLSKNRPIQRIPGSNPGGRNKKYHQSIKYKLKFQNNFNPFKLS
jgi:hypothetical protein